MSSKVRLIYYLVCLFMMACPLSLRCQLPGYQDLQILVTGFQFIKELARAGTAHVM
jgi:hypothetical protein